MRVPEDQSGVSAMSGGLRQRGGGKGAAGDSVFTNQTSESETETETESEIVEEAGARAKLASAAAAEPSGQGGDAGTGEDVQRPAAWKQLGIKMRSAPRIDEKENFSNLQATSKWFPNAYKAPGNENQSAEDEVRRKKAEFWTRTRWTFAMFLSFMFVIASGQLYVMALVVCIKVGMFKEILALKRNKEKDKRIPWFRTLNWYFFATSIYFIYGRILQHHVQVVHRKAPIVPLLYSSGSYYVYGRTPQHHVQVVH